MPSGVGPGGGTGDVVCTEPLAGVVVGPEPLAPVAPVDADNLVEVPWPPS